MSRTWALMVLGVVFGAGLAGAAESPVGKWTTIDEKSGKVVSEVRYKGGSILDPEDGKVYKAGLWIEDGTLKVRGHLGPSTRPGRG